MQIRSVTYETNRKVNITERWRNGDWMALNGDWMVNEMYLPFSRLNGAFRFSRNVGMVAFRLVFFRALPFIRFWIHLQHSESKKPNKIERERERERERKRERERDYVIYSHVHICEYMYFWYRFCILNACDLHTSTSFRHWMHTVICTDEET